MCCNEQENAFSKYGSVCGGYHEISTMDVMKGIIYCTLMLPQILDSRSTLFLQKHLRTSSVSHMEQILGCKGKTYQSYCSLPSVFSE